MNDLIEFLRARLDEDAAVVRALTVPHEWHTGPGDDPEWTSEELVCMWPPEFHTPYEQDKHWRGLPVSGPELAAHVARHDPARVLREVEAKRQILEAHGGDLGPQVMFCPHCEHDTPCPTVRLLAAVYADHPDYRPEWAPAA